ncbi:hypothetical protein PV327_008944 [Microctonus hyperodae]|uniref:gamma-glutamylcyclotransferase n=1 Tax=Microctonus hyperodae TaxID=165561 RepID=A0AA39FTD0_MICHY|nr:hypothetical protein PV327_008944 [Microctonus hyperodae]
MSTSTKKDNKFLYFAYGSNLLAARIRISNPSAEFVDIGRLENYRLDFLGYSKIWDGSPATIISTDNSHVWGVIWELSNEHLETLDRQEGVDKGIYLGFYVDVINETGTVYHCRVYQQTKNIDNHVPLSELPEDRRPSLTYLKIMVKGALECGIPANYIESLKNIKHNGQGSINIEMNKAG